MEFLPITGLELPFSRCFPCDTGQISKCSRAHRLYAWSPDSPSDPSVHSCHLPLPLFSSEHVECSPSLSCVLPLADTAPLTAESHHTYPFSFRVSCHGAVFSRKGEKMQLKVSKQLALAESRHGQHPGPFFVNSCWEGALDQGDLLSRCTAQVKTVPGRGRS